jgi:hypothetical protein
VFGIIPPHKRLTVNVHLDGLQETHDYVCAKDGVFVKALGDDPRVEAPRLPHHHQHHDLQRDRTSTRWRSCAGSCRRSRSTAC